MKNLTLRIDEAVLERVRRHVVLQGTTVSALVRRFLADVAEHEDRAKKARQRIRALSKRSRARIGKATWSRQELHER